MDTTIHTPNASAEEELALVPPVGPHRRVQNLSAVGGDWQAPEYVIDRVVLSDDGVLYVDEEHSDDMRVMSYISRLRLNRVTFDQRMVSHSEIKRLQQTAKDGAALSMVDGPGNTKTAQQEQINRMISEAARLGASDIHFLPDVEKTYVKYRINGIPEARFTLDRAVAEDLVSTLYTSMCEKPDNYEPSRKQNARLMERYARQSGLFVCRIATGPAARGRKLVIRLYPDTGDTPKSMEQLGYLSEQCDQIRQFARKTSGIVLVTGTTGSGKSTTLNHYLKQALLHAEGELIIATAEDPVEQPIRVVLNRDGHDIVYVAVQEPIIPAGTSEEEIEAAWVDAIDHMLRSDPDSILIGEIRGKASVRSAIRAALTGHPTLATLHVKDAISTFDRLEDSGVPRNLLTDPTLFIGIINQALVPILCPRCSIPFGEAEDRLEAGLRDRVRRFCDVSGVRLRGAGCPHCRRGLVGRTVCAEVVSPNPSLMAVYRRQGTFAAQKYWVQKMGGITQCAHLIRLIEAGQVDPDLGELMVRPLDSDDWLNESVRPYRARRSRARSKPSMLSQRRYRHGKA
ncbi:GspE/PulE family protein [Achromobacter aegrifaciens]|jgi:type II secretory ATPase GspE/PulE/Tfp pilus assembly ATPase PilB-like protein